MLLKRITNELLQRAGVQLVSTRRVGVSVFNEVRRTDVQIGMVFDVGANVGHSSIEYLRQFPSAAVHAFEPVAVNFAQLDSISNPRLIRNRCAVGADNGEIKIFLSENAGKHSSVVVEDAGRYEEVGMTTIDGYCGENGIEHIGFLKVDTEGADLAVLQGAEGLLANKAIDFIQVETGFYEKQRHVLISDFISYLSPLGYAVLGVYDQSLEWDGSARVQYANLLFARRGIRVVS